MSSTPAPSPARLPPTEGGGPRGAAARALPDLRTLEAFVCVCESGSMAAAAVRLGLSQSAISQSIRGLEQQHGLQLFDREVRPAQPTRAGRRLLELAQPLLSQARALTEQLRQSARQDYAQIRLGCVDSFAATVGPALIRALSGTAQQMQLWSGLTPGLAAQLQGRELDLAICTETTLADPRIAQRLLFGEAWVAVFPRGAAACPAAAPQALAELRGWAESAGGLPLIRYSQRSVMGRQVDRFLRHLGLDTPRRFEFDATDPLLSLVAAGLGWAISTPLCLWQSRAWLDGVTVLPLPPSRLGQREFFLLSHAGEWAGLDEEILRITRQVLRHEALPALRALMPALPADTLQIPEAPTP
ncbi:LysR family transcriptional regulator [Aquariibacter albus]|uniref:LysR family transcriptional regulator n=1 Tax=Aquariibacter albus TaxID=2759899 RepID=A0A839HEW1_9BURK|nr:LysR family transcriptional regulator [Aquariibacter albus]MBB1160367.1 LysR family transcriptional regulator [Aquariibacter albus]